MICPKCNTQAVENEALHKKFWYCRKCKDEVVPPKQDAKNQSGELNTLNAWLPLSEDTDSLDFSDLGSDIQLKIVYGDYYAKDKIIYQFDLDNKLRKFAAKRSHEFRKVQNSQNRLVEFMPVGALFGFFAWDGGGNL